MMVIASAEKSAFPHTKGLGYESTFAGINDFQNDRRLALFVTASSRIMAIALHTSFHSRK